MSTHTVRGQHLADVGEVLRHWRGIRRMSQMDLAHLAGISPRHLSFVENGHSRAGRDVLERLGEALEMPLRDRNRILVSTGFAPAYAETAPPSPDAAVMTVLGQIMDAAMPFPAIVMDRQWNLVAMNDSSAIFVEGADAELLTPPLSTLRLIMHPGGIGHRISDHRQLCANLLRRLERQIASSGDQDLAEVRRELERYVEPSPAPAAGVDDASDVAVTFGIDYGGHDLRFISTLATIGMPRDVLASELVIETFYPADRATRLYLSRDDAICPQHREMVRPFVGGGT